MSGDQDECNIGVVMARKCSTEALLQVLVERDIDDGDVDATAEELAEVERLRERYQRSEEFAEPANSHARLSELGVTLLPRVVRELVARRHINKRQALSDLAVDVAMRATARKAPDGSFDKGDAETLRQAAVKIAIVAGVDLGELCPVCRTPSACPKVTPEQHMMIFHPRGRKPEA